MQLRDLQYSHAHTLMHILADLNGFKKTEHMKLRGKSGGGIGEDLEGKKWGGYLIKAYLYAYMKFTNNKNESHTIINIYLDQLLGLNKQPSKAKFITFML